jgi:CRP-like cAMP-binding protein
MNKIEILKQNSLFAGVEEKEFDSMLSCLDAREKDYQKDDYILRAGNPIHEIGIVLKGSVTVIKEDYWGNRTIIGRMSVSDMFAESFSFAAITKLPVSVVAAENASILFIDCRQILNTHTSPCDYNSVLTGNMVRILANKNVMLMQKIDHISSRSIREKLLSYLSTQAMNSKNQAFIIPYNRQELADYLCIDRSAMSSELGRLRDEGILRFHKNEFELL